MMNTKVNTQRAVRYARLKDQPLSDSTVGERAFSMKKLFSASGFIWLLSLLLLLVGWQLVVMVGQIPKFILPSPLDVLGQLVALMQNGRLPKHFFLTLSEVLMGLFLGVIIATPLGYLLVKSPLAEKLVSPYLIASQAIPVIAIAPLLTIWIRNTFWMRVVVAVLVVFFPVLVNVIAGLRTVPDELYELMRSLHATKWDIFRKLELPASMPVLLAGLKVGATLSVIGALVGEFIQPKSQGLGFMLVNARFQFKTDEVFAVLVVLGAMALALYGLISLLEVRLLKWQTKK